MLNVFDAVTYISLIYLFSFFPGYVIFLWAKTKGIHSIPFFVRMPIYLALGLMLLTILLFTTGFIAINEYAMITVAILSIIVTLYYHSKSNLGVENDTGILTFDNFLPAALFIITFLHISNVISILEWPPPGDVFNHGLLTSILCYNQKVTFNLAPYDNSMPITPPISGFTGLHILSANLSMLTGVFPGEAVFIVGGAIVVLIPMLIYSLTYILTKSKLFSLFAFLSTFLIGQDLEQWVLGYFYNGPYQNLFGFLAVLLFMVLTLVTGEIQTESNSSLRGNMLLIIILGIFVVYPPFVLFPILYIIILRLYTIKFFGTNDRAAMKHKRQKHFIFLAVISFLVTLILVIADQKWLSQLIKGVYLRITEVYGQTAYAINTSIFYSSIGVAVLFGGIISIFFMVRHIYVRVSLFYLVVFLPVMLSLRSEIFPLFSFILPSRSIMICSLFSWVLLSVLFYHINPVYKRITVKIRVALKNRSYVWQINIKTILVSLIVLLIFTPSLVSNFTYEQANKYNWLLIHGFANDYDVLLWAHQNIKPDELILDDFSFTSWFLLSFSIKNVTSVRWVASDFKRERAIDTLSFLNNPSNISNFLRLINKYNIKYVLVTSEWGHYVWKGIGGDNRYVAKPLKPEEYRSIFDNYPFLKIMHKHGNAGIYKVLPFRLEKRYALRLDGANSYIRVKHDDSLMPSREITIAVLVKPEQMLTGDAFLISKGFNGYELSWRCNKRFALLLNHTIVLESNKIFTEKDLGKWWYIVATFDGLKASIYINGELDSTGNIQITIPYNTEPVSIGCRFLSSECGFFPTSTLREIRIYNRALTYDEVRLLYTSFDIVDNLTLYLPLNEGNGTIAYDHSIYANHGTIYWGSWNEYNVIFVDSMAYEG